MENDFSTHLENEKISWEKAGEGLRRKILGYDEKIMMVVVEFIKGSVGYLHSHPHTQVSYILTGSFEVRVGDTKKVLKAGDSFLAPSNKKHEVTALENASILDVFSPYREDFLK